MTRSETIPDHARHYSISLAPALIPSLGPLISSLVASGVARYGGYRLLERVGIFQQGDRTSGGHDIKSVPGSKEDVFKSKDMSLLEKRRLMRFLMFASGEFEGKKEIEGKEDKPFVSFLKEAFSLDGSVSEAIAYALAFCTTPNGLSCVLQQLEVSTDFVLRRSDTTRSHSSQTLSPFHRTIWRITFPRRSLWWLRRNCSRLLSYLSRQWWCLHPRPRPQLHIQGGHLGDRSGSTYI